jgi:hypothetical protein
MFNWLAKKIEQQIDDEQTARFSAARAGQFLKPGYNNRYYKLGLDLLISTAEGLQNLPNGESIKTRLDNSDELIISKDREGNISCKVNKWLD